MEAMLRLDDESADELALGAYMIEDPILNPRHYPLDERNLLLHGKRLVALARRVLGLGEAQEVPPGGLRALARLFDALELAMEVAAESGYVGTEAL